MVERGIFSVGVDHRSAPLSLLERITPGAELALRLGELARQDGIDECVLLSTCHRVEVYLRTAEPDRAIGLARDIVFGGLGGDALIVRDERDTVEHLFAVTCGLESVVVGEEQVVAQVRDALRLAIEHSTVDHVLSGLFRAALRVSKRARTMTRLGELSSSLVDIGLQRAGEVLGGLRDRAAVVVGAGRMGFLAGPQLRKAGVRTIVVTSRTAQHADKLAAHVWGVQVALDGLPGVVGEADLVISSTGAPGHLLTARQVTAAMAGRPDRPLVILDLALPRDVEPAVGEIPGVTLVDLESLGRWSRERGQRDDLTAVRSVVAAGVDEFLLWRLTISVGPVIGALRAQAARFVDLEVERLHHRLPDLDQRGRQETGEAVRRAVGKLLHTPTVRVKQLCARPDGAAYVEALSTLFDLDSEPTETAS